MAEAVRIQNYNNKANRYISDGNSTTTSPRNKQIQLRRDLSTVSAITMEGEEAMGGPHAVVLLEEEAKQDPLKMFQLLVRGFCPTIIQGRVDMRGEIARVEEEGAQKESSPKNKLYQTITSSSRPSNRARKFTKETVVVAEDDEDGSSVEAAAAAAAAEEKDDLATFELKERPPTDVMGNLKAWKAIWDHWCFQHHQHPDDFYLKGFCTVLTDQYHSMCHDNSNNDRLPPGGEECSVGSSTSNNNNNVGDVDCTPGKSSPRNNSKNLLLSGEQQQQRTRKRIDRRGDVKNEEKANAINEEEEEDFPMMEYPSSRRGLEMLIGTILAVLLTFVLLQLLGTNNQSKKIQFMVQTKSPKGIKQRSQPNILLPEIQAETWH